MRIHNFSSKSIIALVLVLCFAMPVLFSIASVHMLTTHTHICHEEGYKDDCADVIACCRICMNFYNVKKRMQTLYCNGTGVMPVTPVHSSVYLISTDAFISENSATPVSLKVRLNN